MSDPRERDPNMPPNRYAGRQSGMSDGSGWIVAGVIVAILLGVAAYSVRDTQTSSTAPATTSGQSTRAPVPTTPPSAPVAPAPRPQSQPQP
jgi:hypothetical protein